MSICPHCGEVVDASELIEESADDWVCSNCDTGNPDDFGYCQLCSLSREASDFVSDNPEDFEGYY